MTEIGRETGEKEQEMLFPSPPSSLGWPDRRLQTMVSRVRVCRPYVSVVAVGMDDGGSRHYTSVDDD